MSSVKMTEALVSTKAFFVTLSYPYKNEQNEPYALLEVWPVISSEFKDTHLANTLFGIIWHDRSWQNRHLKETMVEQFVSRCSKRLFEEFWDSMRISCIEKLLFTIPKVVCVLYDKHGQVISSHETTTLDLLYAFKKIEQALFTHSLPFKAKEAPSLHMTHMHKEFRRDKNRKTHKYFMHHRAN